MTDTIAPPYHSTVLMPQHGRYPLGWPEGLVIHYTAGADQPAAIIAEGLSKGYAYHYLARDGTLFAPGPATAWGSHAGPSLYPGLGAKVSEHLAGVEIASWGPVAKVGDVYRPDPKFWNGKIIKATVPEDEVRTVGGQAWQIFTEDQEIKLQELILWLADVGPPGVFKSEYILGHSEVAFPPGRKMDPGGCLGMHLPEYRAYIRGLLL